MTLLLHIGYHKTGSTALQTWLGEHTEFLDRYSITFPVGLSSWAGHPEIPWAFAGNRYSWQDQSYNLDFVKEYYQPYLEKSQDDNSLVILSSEELCRLDFEIDVILGLREWLFPFKPIICGYIRNPLDFLLSRYRHEVQEGGEFRSLHEFLSNLDNILSANFHSRTLVWEQSFSNRCIFRNYSLLSKEGGIVQGFVNLLGLRDTDIVIPNPRVGVENKIHPLLIDAVRQLHLEDMDVTEKGNIMNSMLELSKSLPDVPLHKYTESLGISSDTRQILGSLNISTVNLERTLDDLRKIS